MSLFWYLIPLQSGYWLEQPHTARGTQVTINWRNLFCIFHWKGVSFKCYLEIIQPHCFNHIYWLRQPQNARGTQFYNCTNNRERVVFKFNTENIFRKHSICNQVIFSSKYIRVVTWPLKVSKRRKSPKLIHFVAPGWS